MCGWFSIGAQSCPKSWPLWYCRSGRAWRWCANQVRPKKHTFPGMFPWNSGKTYQNGKGYSRFEGLYQVDHLIGNLRQTYAK